MGADTAEQTESVLFDSANSYSKKALFSLLSGFVLCVMAIYPTWATLEFSLLQIFVLMSVLSISYICFAIAGYQKAYYLSHKGSLFSGVSDFYLFVMATLSLYCCLRIIDPTDLVFRYTMLVAVVLVIAVAITLFVTKTQASMLIIASHKVSLNIAVCLMALIVISRFSLLYFDVMATYFFYCTVSALLLSWLLLSFVALRDYSKRKWILKEKEVE